MSPKEFLINKIDYLVVKYPSINCKYAFDGFDNTHTIEITPTSFYHQDEFFLLDENDIYAEFFQLFPYEGLFFISGENEFPVTNPIYIKSGGSFIDYREFVNFNQIDAIELETSTLESHEFSAENHLLPFMSVDVISNFQNQIHNDLWDNLKSNTTIGTNKFALAA